jgi:Rrf2 family nitric oxide-sensitive transcriptional repressor
MAAKRGANCTTDEIAAYFGISAAHLGRVIRRLQKYGYVKAIRGRRGGVRLDREPQAVFLGQVVEVLEEGAQPLDPPTGELASPIDDHLRLRAVLRRGHGLFLNYLHKVTLSELAEDGLPDLMGCTPAEGGFTAGTDDGVADPTGGDFIEEFDRGETIRGRPTRPEPQGVNI